jgi:hypothetical protein
MHLNELFEDFPQVVEGHADDWQETEHTYYHRSRRLRGRLLDFDLG